MVSIRVCNPASFIHEATLSLPLIKAFVPNIRLIMPCSSLMAASSLMRASIFSALELMYASIIHPEAMKSCHGRILFFLLSMYTLHLHIVFHSDMELPYAYDESWFHQP